MPLFLAGLSLRARIWLVVSVVAAGYAATSGALLLHPSPHFHFVDMAESFLHGRLDSDTPRRHLGQAQKPEDPKGLQEAVERALRDGKGNAVGWNDWASFRVLQLKGGETVRGVFPWKDQAGPRAKEFYTLDGRLMLIDVDKDIRHGQCTGLAGISGVDTKSAFRKCDDVVYQISFPPGPALFMLPFVAVFHYHFNDVIYTLLFAVAAALLFFLWLERLAASQLIDHGPGDRLWLTALYAFGTVAWFCSIRGEVWFTAQIMGVALHFAYLLTATGARRPWVAGLILGLAVATRTPLLYAALFLPMQALWPNGRWLGGQGNSALPAAIKKLFSYGIPLVLVGLALAWFNWARWGNPTEFGHFYLLEGTRAPTRDHGLFAFAFLNHNLGTGLLNMPSLSSEAPFLQISRHGLGLLACTPALVALFGPRRRDEHAPELSVDVQANRASLAKHLLISAACVALPGFFYQNDGWQQFGYRFALDFLPPLLGAFAILVPRLNRTTRVLIVLAIVVNLFGAISFGRMEQFYYD